MADILERITLNPTVRSGKPVVRGTRITVTDVLEYLAGGMTPDEILVDFPDLAAEDIQAVLAFAAQREHRLFSFREAALRREFGNSTVTETADLLRHQYIIIRRFYDDPTATFLPLNRA